MCKDYTAHCLKHTSKIYYSWELVKFKAYIKYIPTKISWPLTDNIRIYIFKNDMPSLQKLLRRQLMQKHSLHGRCPKGRERGKTSASAREQTREDRVPSPSDPALILTFLTPFLRPATQATNKPSARTVRFIHHGLLERPGTRWNITRKINKHW